MQICVYFDQIRLVEVKPDYLHFTPKVNLPLIEKTKTLGLRPEGYTTGCSIGCGATYGYNLDLIKQTKFQELSQKSLGHFKPSGTLGSHHATIEKVTEPSRLDPWLSVTQP